MVAFNGTILIIGCGAVAQCVIPLLFKLIDVQATRIIILDPVDNRARIKNFLERGVRYLQERITQDNYKLLLSRFLSTGDICIDLSLGVDTISLLEWCYSYGVMYINSSLESWEQPPGLKNSSFKTEYLTQEAIENLIKTWPHNKGPTAVINSGANPGLVSHFAKQGLLDIAQEIIKQKPTDSRRAKIEQAIANNNFALLAYLINLKAIHIAERDTQIVDKPKQLNEFVNTWSIRGFIEECQMSAEIGWGTHERLMPRHAKLCANNSCSTLYFNTAGMFTLARSWVPNTDIIGMVISHGESVSIARHLTLIKDNTAIYRPTVAFIYCPCDSAINSLHELVMRNFQPQEKQRIITDEIINGGDILGCLLLGHDLNAWWIGSLLTIEKTRALIPHQNATTLQVAIGIISTLIFMIKNPFNGVCSPEDIDHQFVLSIAKPYLEPFISQAVNWTPLTNTEKLAHYYPRKPINPEDIWQFNTFLL